MQRKSSLPSEKIAENLEAQLRLYKKAAEQDLEKQIMTGKDKAKEPEGKAESGRTESLPPPRKKIKPTTAKAKDAGRRSIPPASKMIEDVKQEEESGKEEDDEELQARGKHAALELEDGDPASEDLRDLESGSDDDSEEGDADVFDKEFALPAAAANRFDGLPERLRKQADEVCKDVLASIPADMSTTLVLDYRAREDYMHMLRILLAEEITTIDTMLCVVAETDGKLSDNLGDSAKIFKKMSLKGKSSFNKWATGFPDYVLSLEDKKKKEAP
ncbi:unnamed protein product [Symbiodinium sp. CCMP2592]|nr:unnamed protein product [Symbiodinium sp. CCMP2592]